MSFRRIVEKVRQHYSQRAKKPKPKHWQVPMISEKIFGARLFNKAFGEYLFLTNTLTGGGLMLVGDVIQQEIEYRRHAMLQRYDWMRMGRMFVVGLAMGPLHHYFYKYLDTYLPGRNFFAISKKILMDQFLMSPICIATFFYGMGLLEGRNKTQCTAELNSKFVEVYLIDWSVWPPTQFINFYFLPVQYQVLYINFVTMVYNVFLSYMKHREIAQEIRGDESEESKYLLHRMWNNFINKQ